MTRTRLVAILAALATALFMSACSNNEATDGHTDHSHAEETITVTGEPAGFNAADISFADNMIPHHQQAIELTELVPGRSTNPELLELANQIAAAQDPEINTMKAFLVQWKENPDDSTGDGGHGDHAGMAGMVDEATMTQLETLSGPEFDTLWLQSMIAHHEGAVEMAEEELANGSNVDAKSLAQTIIDGQQAEIAQMKAMLDGS